MLFNSLQYAVFLPIVFTIYWIIPHKYRWALLLTASYYFYMSWNASYLILIVTTTFVSYLAARLIEAYGEHKKHILVVALVVCLGILFTFKYYDFVMETLNDACSCLGIKLHVTTLSLLLPVGISFYTFQTLSYVIDVYRGTIEAEHHFGIYAAFISFFPQLVAGPIERSTNLLPQIKNEQEFRYDQASYGLKLMAWGFFKKLAIADVIAVYVDRVYGNIEAYTGFDLLLVIFLFSIQIYCDFSGYSDIAIGSAKLMGINLMNNFKSPYYAEDFKEFWDRWHISLSSWLRDYVYIPLGGNRCSKMRQQLNLMITFLASGLWHGANWTFVLWGGIHGLFRIVENSFLRVRDKKHNTFHKVACTCVTFILCSLTWVIFRSQDMGQVVAIFTRLFDQLSQPGSFLHSELGISYLEYATIFISIMILAIYDYCSLKNDAILLISEKNTVVRWLVYLAIIYGIWFLMPKTGTSEFVYFQF